MSGGSFNYLYCKDSEDILDTHMDELNEMIEVLRNDYDSPNRRYYVNKLNKAYTLLKTCKSLIESADTFLDEDLKKVMMAVEWHKSNDTDKQSVEDALEWAKGMS